MKNTPTNPHTTNTTQVAAEIANMGGHERTPAAGASGGESAWVPVVDPTTNATYYHNTETNATSWALPANAATA